MSSVHSRMLPVGVERSIEFSCYSHIIIFSLSLQSPMQNSSRIWSSNWDCHQQSAKSNSECVTQRLEIPWQMPTASLTGIPREPTTERPTPRTLSGVEGSKYITYMFVAKRLSPTPPPPSSTTCIPRAGRWMAYPGNRDLGWSVPTYRRDHNWQSLFIS